MLLNEFFKFDADDNAFKDNRRYDANHDKDVIRRSDTRKVKLTLRDINRLRLQSEAHEAEAQSELGFIKQMYGNPENPDEEPAI